MKISIMQDKDLLIARLISTLRMIGRMHGGSRIGELEFKGNGIGKANGWEEGGEFFLGSNEGRRSGSIVLKKSNCRAGL